MLPSLRLAAAVAALRPQAAPLAGVWFRAINPRFAATALSAAHTRHVRSRFGAGHLLPALHRFEMLYFAETPVVAMFEVGAMIGSALRPGASMPHPAATFLVLNVSVQLSNWIDLTRTVNRQQVATTFEELTGDWESYYFRGTLAQGALAAPARTAPTQDLGQALYHCPGAPLDGF